MSWVGWVALAVALYLLLSVLTYRWYREHGGSLGVALLAASDVEFGGHCAKCGAENATEYVYCHNCTSRLAA